MCRPEFVLVLARIGVRMRMLVAQGVVCSEDLGNGSSFVCVRVCVCVCVCGDVERPDTTSNGF